MARPKHQRPITVPMSSCFKLYHTFSPLANKEHAFAFNPNTSRFKSFLCSIFKMPAPSGKYPAMPPFLSYWRWLDYFSRQLSYIFHVAYGKDRGYWEQRLRKGTVVFGHVCHHARIHDCKINASDEGSHFPTVWFAGVFSGCSSRDLLRQ